MMQEVENFQQQSFSSMAALSSLNRKKLKESGLSLRELDEL